MIPITLRTWIRDRGLTLLLMGMFALFAVGSRDGVAVAAVLASQFAAIAAVAAYFLFKERLTRVQLAGVATIVAGVAILTALQA